MEKNVFNRCAGEKFYTFMYSIQLSPLNYFLNKEEIFGIRIISLIKF